MWSKFGNSSISMRKVKVVGFYPATLLRKENLINLFSCKFHEIFKNRFFIEALGATASESICQAVCLDIITKTSKSHQLRQIILTILGILKMLFFCWDNYKFSKSRIFQGKYLWWSFVVVKPLPLRFILILPIC